MNAGSSTKKVGIIMGSANDAEVLELSRETLRELDIACEFRALSAHRTPDVVIEWAQTAEERGIGVIIAAAGLAAHLAGVVAANTTIPVIGVPVGGGSLNGLDALLSTVQMPRGTPVGAVAIGKSGAVNAALFAARILALSDEGLAKRVKAHKDKLRQEVIDADRKLQG